MTKKWLIILVLFLSAGTLRLVNHKRNSYKQVPYIVNEVPKIIKASKQKHKLIWQNRQAFILCDNIIILHTLVEKYHANWSISECPECGMLIETTGDCEENSNIYEVNSRRGQNFYDLNNTKE